MGAEELVPAVPALTIIDTLPSKVPPASGAAAVPVPTPVITSAPPPVSGERLNITIGKAEYILPLEPREPGCYFLSNLDQNVCLVVKTVYLFKANPEKKDKDPTEVLRYSLAKLLNVYWPMAGRLTLSPEMKLIANYNKDGVCFVEAIADAALVDLGNLSKPSDRLAQLLYEVPTATNILETPLMVAQVTKFRCGGWALGLSLQHSMADGIAANEFIKAWGETAQGIPISIHPMMDRSILKARSPLKVEFPHGEFKDLEILSKDSTLDCSEDIVHKSFCYSLEDLAVLKQRAMEDGELKKCTTFEVLSGLIWRARTRAFLMDPEQETRLYFAVDGRAKFVPHVPEGYFGNAIVLTYSITKSEDLIERPLSHSVKLVQEAIQMIDDNYMRSAIDYFEMTRARPALNASVCITTWSRLPFHASNFGWGEPIYSGPVTLPDKEVVLFLSHGKERKSINVLLGLPRKVMERFEEALEI